MNLVCFYRTFDSTEADLIKSQLDSENIYCLIKSHDASGVLPHLRFAQGGIEVLIRQEDLKRVQGVLHPLKELKR